MGPNKAHLCVKARVLTHIADVDRQPRGSHELGDAVVDQPIGARELLHANGQKQR